MELHSKTNRRWRSTLFDERVVGFGVLILGYEAGVCKMFYQIGSDNIVWRKFVRGIRPREDLGNVNVKETFYLLRHDLKLLQHDR